MKEDVLEKIEELAIRLRREGMHIGTSEILDFVRIVENMEVILGRGLSDDELLDIAKAVFAKNTRDEEIIEKVWRGVRVKQEIARVMAAVESDLRKLGLEWGSKVYSKRRLLSGPRAEEKREAYSRLHLLGLITRSPRGGVCVVDRETALRRIESMLRRYGSAWDALAESAARLIERGRLEWFSLYAAPVDERSLAKVDVDKIAVAALQALSEGNRRLASKLASIVSKRLEAGESPRDSWSVYRLLDKLDMLTPRSVASMLRGEPKLALELLRSSKRRDILAEALRLLDPRSLGSVLRKIVRDPRGLSIAANLIGEVDLSAWSEVYLSRTPRTWEEAVIAAASLLARVERSLLAAARGSEAELDYALSEWRKLERINIDGAPAWAVEALRRYRARVEAELAGFTTGQARIEAIVKSMSPLDALLYLREVYRTGNNDLKRKALRLAELVWRKLEARLYGYKRSSDKRVTAKRGRVDIRRSVYNLISLREEPIVFRDRLRKPLYALILDVSGSMAKYSIWGLLSASCFASAVKTLTLFSSNVTVINNAWRLSRRRLIEILFSVEFEGYTNISAALRETSRFYTSAAKAIVITDLCQTVVDERPSEVVASLVKRGWSFLFILPPRHCVAEKSAVEGYARVEVVAEPDRIPHVITKLLA